MRTRKELEEELSFQYRVLCQEARELVGTTDNNGEWVCFPATIYNAGDKAKSIKITLVKIESLKKQLDAYEDTADPDDSDRRTCPHCNADIPGTYAFCPICGYTL
jgi:hypothetical protein